MIHFRQFGLQRTSTNLINDLLINNFDCDFPPTDWKHGLIKAPAPDMHVILSTKNPYAWIISSFVFFKRNWIEPLNDFRCPNFLANRTTWTLNDYLTNRCYAWNNPIQRYNFCNNHWLEHSEFVARSEDMLGKTNQINVLKKIQDKFKLVPKQELQGVDTVRFGPHFDSEHYEKRKYLKYFTNKQLTFINNELDENLMNVLGYEMVPNDFKIRIPLL